MTKAVRNEGSAYVIYPGISREDAEKKGLTIVEWNFSGGNPVPVYGRYDDAPKGSGLGVTVPVGEDTEVVGGGSVGPDQTDTGGKGDTMRPVDPIARPEPGTNPHKDGGEPAKLDADVPQEPKSKGK